MRGLLSNRPLVALILVAIVVAGALLLVGTDERQGALVTTAEKIEANASDEQEPAQDEAGEKEQLEFIDDEELIDDAEGFEPEPMIDLDEEEEQQGGEEAP